jgi:hypothetical protein
MCGERADLTDAVRASCAAVAARARFVAIAREALPAYAASLPLADVAAPNLDPAFHYLGDEADTAAYVLTLDTINFGSGYFPRMRKRGTLSGYFTVALSLKEAFEREGPWSAATLAAMTPARCAAVFGQAPAFPLMALFARALSDFGRLLLAEYGGQPLALVRAADGSAERLASSLTAMPYYRDVAEHDGRPVAFYKRAQLAAADLALALAEKRETRSEERERRAAPPAPQSWGEKRQARSQEQVPEADSSLAPRFSSLAPLFRDLDRLTIFADNVVPHVLRVDGLLRYDARLLARIYAEESIAPGSPEEVEIRACAVHAVELLKAELARRGHAITANQLDYYLWNRGRAARYKALPRHRSPGVYY